MNWVEKAQTNVDEYYEEYDDEEEEEEQVESVDKIQKQANNYGFDPKEPPSSMNGQPLYINTMSTPTTAQVS